MMRSVIESFAVDAVCQVINPAVASHVRLRRGR